MMETTGDYPEPGGGAEAHAADLALQQIADLLRTHKGDACTWVQQIRNGPLMCVTHDVELF